MSGRAIFYILLFLVAIVSGVLGYVLEASPLIKNGLGGAAISAMMLLLGKIILDALRYEDQLSIQYNEQVFELGLTSHMANTAFDKHVAFCEAYMQDLEDIAIKIKQGAPTKVERELVSPLREIRRRHSTWLTPDLYTKLDQFEGELWNLACNGEYFAELDGRKERNEVLNDIYKTFKALTDIDENSESDFMSLEACKQYVRSILDIDKLVTIRKNLIHRLYLNSIDT